MAINYPGPYVVEIFYTINSANPLQHKMALNCDVAPDPTPGDLFPTISVVENDATTISLAVAVNDFLDLVKPFYFTGETFDEAILWKYLPNSFERQFISSYTPTVTNGTNATNRTIAHQLTQSYRSAEGGIAKLVFLEAASTQETQIGYATIGVAAQALVDYVLGAGGWIIARDTSRLTSFIRQSGGQNEAVWRKRFR